MNGPDALHRSRGETRRAAILAAARDVFLEYGYGAATLDEIIRRAGGSRATLYGHFGGKDGLFAAIIARLCEEIVAPLDRPAPEADFESTLGTIGRHYLETLLSPEGLALYRLVASESARFPELGQRVYAAGPQAAARGLAAYLRREATRNDLSLADPDLAARHFLELVKGDLHARALFNAGTPSKAEINACVREGVRTFLHGIKSIWRAA